MKGISSILLVAVCATGALCATIGNTTLEDDAWWGPAAENGAEIDTSIRTFTPEFTDEMIEGLRYRLKNHRPFVAPLDGVGFSYGFNSDHIEEWIQYWAEEYPFAEREEFINQYPHYKTNIQGLDIHFVRVTPKVSHDVEVVPLLLLHGFPGSFMEFYDAIPLLTAVSDDRDFACELIIPSLPGYVYSDATSTPGLGTTEMGVVMRNLMKRLGYDKYYIQGGDWGAFVASTIATIFPEEVLGHHTNFAVSLHPQTLLAWLLGSNYPDLVVDSSLADRMYPLSKIFKFFAQEFGYYHLQAAKPDTIGIVLSDSPSSLLAYIIQLASMATRAEYTYSEDGGLENQFTKAQVMDHLTLYWSTNCITTAMRTYAETTNFRTYGLGVLTMPSTALTWTIHAPDELIYQSPYLLKFKYPYLVNSTVLETGGHFLPMELPDIFADDVLTALTAFRKIHKDNGSGAESKLKSEATDQNHRTQHTLESRRDEGREILSMWRDQNSRHGNTRHFSKNHFGPTQRKEDIRTTMEKRRNEFFDRRGRTSTFNLRPTQGQYYVDRPHRFYF